MIDKKVNPVGEPATNTVNVAAAAARRVRPMAKSYLQPGAPGSSTTIQRESRPRRAYALNRGPNHPSNQPSTRIAPRPQQPRAASMDEYNRLRANTNVGDLVRAYQAERDGGNTDPTLYYRMVNSRMPRMPEGVRSYAQGGRNYGYTLDDGTNFNSSARLVDPTRNQHQVARLDGTWDTPGGTPTEGMNAIMEWLRQRGLWT